MNKESRKKTKEINKDCTENQRERNKEAIHKLKNCYKIMCHINFWVENSRVINIRYNFYPVIPAKSINYWLIC